MLDVVKVVVLCCVFKIPTNPIRMRLDSVFSFFYTGKIPTNPTRMRLGFK